MYVYETILKRRTIRKFRQEEISKSTLEKLVNAARLAPSAANLQPLEYLVITEDSLKQQIFPSLSWAGYLKPHGTPKKGEEPAAYIVILVNRRINPRPDIDIGAGAQNINLAAEEEGIGCCWIGASKKRTISRILNISQDYAIGLIIALGYPAEKSVIEDIEKNLSIKYYKDSSGIHHVPKRKLGGILHWNKL